MTKATAQSNRIEAAFGRMAKQTADRLASGEVTMEAVEACAASLDMEYSEFGKLQELKSIAVGGTLTLEEAQTIYAALGETPEHFNAQPVHVKAVLTQLFAELLKQTICQKQSR